MGDIGWIVVTIGGLCIGIGLGYWLGKAQRGADSAKLAEARAELEGYRAKVTEHFSQSAAHFHAIGRQYRELYEHMAAGSDDLCNTSDRGTPLHFPSPEAVAALERDKSGGPGAGARASDAAASAASRPIDYAVDEAGDDDAPQVSAETPALEAESSDAVQTGTKKPDGAESAQSEDDLQSAKSAGPDEDKESAITDETVSTETSESKPEKRLYH